jgi:hypothetical protein
MIIHMPRNTQAAGIKTKSAITRCAPQTSTAYLRNGGTREHAQAMAAHFSARTTQLWTRKVSLDEYEKVGI